MNQIEQYAAIIGVGVISYLGKLFYSKTRLSFRNIVGAAFIGGVLGLISGAAMLWIANIPIEAMLGIAAAISTVGHEMFKDIVEAFVYKTTGKDIDKKDQ